METNDRARQMSWNMATRDQIASLEERIALLEGLVERMGRFLAVHARAGIYAHWGEGEAPHFPFTLEGQELWQRASDAHNLPEDAPPSREDVL